MVYHGTFPRKWFRTSVRVLSLRDAKVELNQIESQLKVNAARITAIEGDDDLSDDDKETQKSEVEALNQELNGRKDKITEEQTGITQALTELESDIVEKTEGLEEQKKLRDAAIEKRDAKKKERTEFVENTLQEARNIISVHQRVLEAFKETLVTN